MLTPDNLLLTTGHKRPSSAPRSRAPKGSFRKMIIFPINLPLLVPPSSSLSLLLPSWAPLICSFKSAFTFLCLLVCGAGHLKRKCSLICIYFLIKK